MQVKSINIIIIIIFEYRLIMNVLSIMKAKNDDAYNETITQLERIGKSDR